MFEPLPDEFDPSNAYRIERSHDAFLIFPYSTPQDAVICDSLNELWKFLQATSDDAAFLISDEAFELMSGERKDEEGI